MTGADHGVRVHYETQRGGVSWADVDVRAASSERAHELAADRVRADRRRNVRRVFKTEITRWPPA